MTNLNNEICELSLNELDAVNGGTWMDTVICVTAAGAATSCGRILFGQAVDGIPAAPCRPKG